MSRSQKYLIVIGGPTAVGKSALAMQLAQELHTEILSADSRQLFRQLDIGTAKPSPDELAAVRHHFVDHCDLTETFTVYQYEKEALALLEQLYRHRNVAVVCGGTGLYIKALLQGLDEIPSVPIAVRDQLERQLGEKGLAPLQARLRALDPDYYMQVDPHNPRRLLRALSVIEHTGRPFSSFLRQQPKPRPFVAIPILLEMDRTMLYERIERRVDEMLARGLEAEVKSLIPHRHTQALQTVGYQEWMPYFDGEIDLPEVIRLIKRNSRRYAKRQMTWFRKDDYWHRLREPTLVEVLQVLKEGGLKI